MKKNYILLSGMILASCLVFAQSRVGAQKFLNQAPLEKFPTQDIGATDIFAPKGSQLKAVGDTMPIMGGGMAYFDFDSASVANNWTIVNNNANNFQWTWNTVYQNGQFSTTAPAIQSTSTANGFMSLPCDFYNTPIPGTGAVTMDTYFESPNIHFSSPKPSVWLAFQQYVRFCCSSANRLVVQVSSDNFATFTEYDATNDLDVNASNTGTVQGGAIAYVDISTAAANEDSIRVRFLSSGNSHYFWMIDDLAVIEGPENDLELNDAFQEFHGANYAINPFYGEIPFDLFPPLFFSGEIVNLGSNTATNVSLDVDVTHDSFPNGSAGTGLAYSISQATNPVNMVSNAISDSGVFVETGTPNFVPTVLGNFTVDFIATSDSMDNGLVIDNEIDQLAFLVNDSTLHRHDNVFGIGVGPASYVRGGQPGATLVGDKYGTLVIVESNTGNGGLHTRPTSVCYWVSDDVRNIGVEIVPKMWEFDEDSSTIAAAFIGEVATSFIPYTVVAADTNSLLCLNFDAGTAVDPVTGGLSNSQYVVGWETTSIAGGTTFEVYNDASSAASQPLVSNFLDFGHSPGWGWTDDNPGIELNLGHLPIPTSLASPATTSSNLEVLPNPNNGLFNLKITSEIQVDYNLNIRNMLGQTVMTDYIYVNGQVNQTVDLTSFEKGVYFVSLENDSEKILKKVVVK